jgi:hypothetical protein
VLVILNDFSIVQLSVGKDDKNRVFAAYKPLPLVFPFTTKPLDIGPILFMLKPLLRSSSLSEISNTIQIFIQQGSIVGSFIQSETLISNHPKKWLIKKSNQKLLVLPECQHQTSPMYSTT